MKQTATSKNFLEAGLGRRQEAGTLGICLLSPHLSRSIPLSFSQPSPQTVVVSPPVYSPPVTHMKEGQNMGLVVVCAEHCALLGGGRQREALCLVPSCLCIWRKMRGRRKTMPCLPVPVTYIADLLNMFPALCIGIAGVGGRGCWWWGIVCDLQTTSPPRTFALWPCTRTHIYISHPYPATPTSFAPFSPPPAFVFLLLLFCPIAPSFLPAAPKQRGGRGMPRFSAPRRRTGTYCGQLASSVARTKGRHI